MHQIILVEEVIPSNVPFDDTCPYGIQMYIELPGEVLWDDLRSASSIGEAKDQALLWVKQRPSRMAIVYVRCTGVVVAQYYHAENGVLGQFIYTTQGILKEVRNSDLFTCKSISGLYLPLYARSTRFLSTVHK